MTTDAAAPEREIDDQGGSVLQTGWSLVCRSGRGIRWFFTSLMGDGAYATYVAHHRRTHPGVEPLTEREFWREKMADQDRNPGSRCC